ncbi:MAG: LPS export ABC transporter periplasmic protein LptC [Armatimonadetes bacterium]|nr:LPS export ABC transporter periplasmic protein LptC [Armatimonadota bacterium]
MKVRRRAATAAVLAVLGLAILWYVSRSGFPVGTGGPRPTHPPPAASPAAAPPPAAAPGSPGSPSLPPITVEESRIRGADPAGGLQWELRAAALQVDADREEVRLEGVEGTFLERGKTAVTFTAPRAIFQMKTRDIILSGGVRARASGGRAVEAQQVRWLAARRLLIATGRVRLTQERMIVRADRLESDIALRRTRLRGHISVTIRE